MGLGVLLRGRIPADAFRTLLFIVFGLLGLALIAKEIL